MDGAINFSLSGEVLAGLSLKKNNSLALLRALGADKYDTSLFVWRHMLLAWYLTSVFGYVAA